MCFLNPKMLIFRYCSDHPDRGMLVNPASGGLPIRAATESQKDVRAASTSRAGVLLSV